MTSFADIEKDQIHFDCRFYTGYKPCGKYDGCPDCPHYEKRGEQILIIKLAAMGDVLRTKAILPALKRDAPESWIVWVTAPGSECIARDPMVDEIRTLTAKGVLALEGRKFSRLYCLDKDAEALALSKQLDAEKRFGFAPTEYNTVSVWNEASMYALRLGLSDPLKFHRNEKSVPRIVSEMCELPYGGNRYTLEISEAARHGADERWKKVFRGVDEGKIVVGLNTGCGPVFATKGWPRERMAEFLQLAGKRDDMAVVLLGGPRERDIHEFLMRDAPANVYDSGNDNQLEVFFAIVDRCDVVLSSDSLAMHVAIALAKPVVAWFGPTCSREVDLYGCGEKIVTDFPCAPCYLKECPQPVFCLEAMTAKTVYTALDRVLSRA